MKKFHLLILTFLVLAACKENSVDSTATQPAPVVLTKDADSVTATKAILVGEITGNAYATFEYGTSTSYGNTINAVPNYVNGKATVTATLGGLTPRTTYHFRARASNPAFVNGNDMTFVTDQLKFGDVYQGWTIFSTNPLLGFKVIDEYQNWETAKITAAAMGGYLSSVSQQLILFPFREQFGLTEFTYWTPETDKDEPNLVVTVIFNSPNRPEINGQLTLNLQTFIFKPLVVRAF